MENTGKVLFKDDSPQWYVALGERWVGPLSAADVYKKVVEQEISWAHFVWKAGQAEWKRICDVKAFQSVVPALPPKAEAPKTAPPPAATRVVAVPKAPTVSEWFLYYNETQFGPFSSEEISRFLRVGKIHGRVHIWRDGMPNWTKIEAVTQFLADVAEAKQAREKKVAGQGKTPPAPRESEKEKEQRKTLRKPVVAKIMMANQEALIVAICRDISIGGMQVLTDRIPGKPGTRIKLNVSPAGRSGAADVAQGDIEPFVAEGVVVRVLEDGRGFSFRFERLPEASQRAIEKYIEAAGV
ncbi:GYF domain-containing protein [Bdellovibrionota bacterium FG-1]